MTAICFRSLDLAFSEPALLPWAGFEMQILRISMNLPFQIEGRQKNKK